MSDYLKEGFIDQVKGSLNRGNSGGSGTVGSGQENVIEKIKVNGVEQSVDGNKAVNIPVPTKTSELENDEGFLKEHQDLSEYAKSKDVPTVPSNVSEFTNDKQYQTADDVTGTLEPYAKSADVTKQITDEVAKIVANAPEDFDTLKEMSDWIANHENDASAMNSAIQANKTDIAGLCADKADLSDLDGLGVRVTTVEGEVDGVNRKLCGIEEGAEPTAATISGSNPTVTNSANAPLIYGKIKGYTLQDGEPTPDNPIDIKGLGDSGTIKVRTCGKNLLSHPLMSGTEYGLTRELNDDGSLTFIGTTTNQITYLLDDIISRLKVGETYIWSGVTNVRIIEGGTILYKSGDGSYTITENTTAFTPYFQWNSVGTTLNTTFYPMVRIKGTDDTYEPYTETVTTIPIDTLYEGDYLEVYADGSGKIVSNNSVFTPTNVTLMHHDSSWADGMFRCEQTPSDIKAYSNTSDTTVITSTHFPNTKISDMLSNVVSNGVSILNKTIFFKHESIMTSDDLKTWFGENTVKVIYPLATPIETPLTAEQVEQFKKLYTFDNVTNFFCDGEITARYYCNTDSGYTVGMLQEQAKENLEQIKNDLSEQESSVDQLYLNALPVGSIVQIEQYFDTLQESDAKDKWLYLGTSSIQYDNGAAVNCITNVYRKLAM